MKLVNISKQGYQLRIPIFPKVDLNLLPKNLPVIRFNDASLDSVQIELVLRQCNFHGGRSIAVDTNQSAMNLVANGIGWTILPPLGIWAAKDFLPAVSLHNIDSLHSTRQFYGDCHEFCVHGIIGARHTGTPHEHDYQETNLS